LALNLAAMEDHGAKARKYEVWTRPAVSDRAACAMTLGVQRLAQKRLDAGVLPDGTGSSLSIPQNFKADPHSGIA